MDFLRLTKKDHLPTWCDLTESPESEGGDRQRRGAVELWGAAQCSSERQREQQKKKQEEGEEGRAGGGWGVTTVLRFGPPTPRHDRAAHWMERSRPRL